MTSRGRTGRALGLSPQDIERICSPQGRLTLEQNETPPTFNLRESDTPKQHFTPRT